MLRIVRFHNFFALLLLTLPMGCGSHHHKSESDSFLAIDKLPALIPIPRSEVYDGKEKLGPWAKGLTTYLPLDGDTQSFLPSKIESAAEFVRNSLAWNDDLTAFAPNQPRFAKGKFGKGIMIEQGYARKNLFAGRNFFTKSISCAEAINKCFQPVGQSVLSIVKNDALGTALQVMCEKADSGFETAPTKMPAAINSTFSFYVKGRKGDELEFGFAEVKEHVTLTGKWQRLFINYNRRKNVWQPENPVDIDVKCWAKLKTPGTFKATALMLEAHVEAKIVKVGPSSWVPGDTLRHGEALVLPDNGGLTKGTVAFWFKPVGNIGSRRLLNIGHKGGWKPKLLVDIQSMRKFYIFYGKERMVYKFDKIMPPDEWHHLAISWRDKTIRIDYDGKTIIEKKLEQDIDLSDVMSIGGVPSIESIPFRADAVFDEVCVWNRFLDNKEIQSVYQRKTPISDGIDNKFTLQDEEPITIFPRDYRKRIWRLMVRNRSEKKVDGITLSCWIGKHLVSQKTLPSIDPWRALVAGVEWSPAKWLPGDYEMTFSLETPTENSIGNERKIKILPARVPFNQLQTISWRNSEKAVAELGLSMAGVHLEPTMPLSESLRNAIGNDFYLMLQEEISGTSNDPKTMMENLAGFPYFHNHSEKSTRDDLIEKASEFGQKTRLYPDARILSINPNHYSFWSFDFNDKTCDWVKQTFSLDLKKWKNLPRDKKSNALLPQGRLSGTVVGIEAPKSGIVSIDDPFYRFHRWWHSDRSGNIITVDDLVAKIVKKNNFWLETMVEPAVERPFIRSFTDQNILQQSFFIDDPARAILTQELLAAFARGTEAKTSPLMEFYIPALTAAPFGSIPTPGLYKETLWNILSRPSRSIGYRGLSWVVEPVNKNALTQKQLNEYIKTQLKLGDSTSFDKIAERLKVQNGMSTRTLFIPELKETISASLKNEVAALAPLCPRWKNRPRKMGVYLSFASQLYNSPQDPLDGEMIKALRNIPYPYDILFDQDFESEENPLTGMNVLLVASSPIITKTAETTIKTFIERGGLVVVDQLFKPDISGIIKIDWEKEKDHDLNGVNNMKRKLLAKYGTLDHVEYKKMMSYFKQKIGSTEGATYRLRQLLDKHLEMSVKPLCEDVFINTLQAEGATYLTVVNDLRVGGQYFGEYGKVFEKGISRKANFELSGELGSAAYDLTTNQRIPINKTNAKSTMTLTLPECAGRTLIFLPDQIDKLTLFGPDKSVNEGDDILVKATLKMKNGKPVPGIIPVKMTIVRPDGSVDDMSGHTAFVNGELLWIQPIPYNAPKGSWSITVKELASGRSGKITFALNTQNSNKNK